MARSIDMHIMTCNIQSISMWHMCLFCVKNIFDMRRGFFCQKKINVEDFSSYRILEQTMFYL